MISIKKITSVRKWSWNASFIFLLYKDNQRLSGLQEGFEVLRSFGTFWKPPRFQPMNDELREESSLSILMLPLLHTPSSSQWLLLPKYPDMILQSNCNTFFNSYRWTKIFITIICRKIVAVSVAVCKGLKPQLIRLQLPDHEWLHLYSLHVCQI